MLPLKEECSICHCWSRLSSCSSRILHTSSYASSGVATFDNLSRIVARSSSIFFSIFSFSLIAASFSSIAALFLLRSASVFSRARLLSSRALSFCLRTYFLRSKAALLSYSRDSFSLRSSLRLLYSSYNFRPYREC